MTINNLLKNSRYKKLIHNISYATKMKLEKTKFPNLANEFIFNLQEFIPQLLLIGYVNFKNFDTAIEKLEKLQYISVLPTSSRNIYSISTIKFILINPEISKSNRKLYLYKELAKLIINMDCNKLHKIWFSYAKDYNKKYGIDLFAKPDRKYVEYGLTVLEEAITYEIANSCLYNSINKKPQKSDTCVPDANFILNLDSYKIYLPLTIAFVKTLSYMKPYMHDDEYLIFEFCKRAIDSNVTDDIIAEYQNRIGIFALYNIFGKFGAVFERLLRKKNAGNNDISDEIARRCYIDVLKEIASLRIDIV